MVLVHALGLQFEWPRARDNGQQLAASTSGFVIIVKTFLRKTKGMESIDTKFLAVELKQFIDIYSRKGVGWTQLGHLVQCRTVLIIGVFIIQTGKQ